MITILLIRGLSRQQGHWGEFSKILTQTFNHQDIEVSLVFEDLPGFGSRYQQKSPASIEEIAELLVPTLAKFHKETGRKIHLLGISMGGMVALALAQRFPDYCESLIMINSSVKPASKFYQRLQPKAYPAIFKAWCHPNKRKSECAILNISTEHYKNDAFILAQWLALRTQFPPSRMAVLKQMVAASMFRAPIKPPVKKVLLIASKHDRIAHYSCTLNLAKLWGVPCLLHAQAGHDLALDDPEWLASQIVFFI